MRKVFVAQTFLFFTLGGTMRCQRLIIKKKAVINEKPRLLKDFAEWVKLVQDCLTLNKCH